jgi:hypothetical protein
MLTVSRLVVSCAALSLATCSLLAQDKDDALAKVLHAKGGVAIVPYAQQSEAIVGAVVAQPFDGELPVLRRAAKDVPAAKDDEMVIPGDDMAKIKQAGLEVKVFGFDFGGKFNNYSTLSFQTMKLMGKKIEYDDVLDLVKPGTETDTLLRTYVNPKATMLGNINYTANLYVIGKVFTTTGVEVTSTSGTEITLQSGQTMPACPALPDTGDGKPKTDTPTKTDKPTDDKSKDKSKTDPTSSDPAKGDDKSKDKDKKGDSVDVNIGGVKVDASTGDSGSSDPKSGTKGIDDKSKAGLKLDSPSGAVQVCVKDKSHVILTTDHPIPIAMLVWNVALKAPLGGKASIKTDTWNPVSDSPMFVLGK